DEAVELTRGEGGADAAALEILPGETVSVLSVSQDDMTFVEGTDYTASVSGGTLRITWLENGARPAEGSAYTVEVAYCPQPRIAGVEKHATPSISGGAGTSASTEIVDGYSALSDADLALANTGGVALDGQFRWI